MCIEGIFDFKNLYFIVFNHTKHHILNFFENMVEWTTSLSERIAPNPNPNPLAKSDHLNQYPSRIKNVSLEVGWMKINQMYLKCIDKRSPKTGFDLQFAPLINRRYRQANLYCNYNSLLFTEDTTGKISLKIGLRIVENL